MNRSHLRRIAPAKSREKSPSLNDQAGHGTQRGRRSTVEVGAVLRGRIRYCVRFARYLAIHRNIENVRWVLACEGTQW